jgi:D-alanyl-D-alanine carboxypeptidase
MGAMARRVWVIGAVGAAIVAFVSAPNSSDETAATSAATSATSATSASTSPETTGEAPVTTPTTSSSTTTTTEPPQTSTSTLTTTTTSTPSVTTVPRARTGSFNGDAFDAVIAAATVERGDLAAGVAVLRGGTVLHTAAFGMENPFEGKAATVETRFRIASVSKILTAVAIMQLVEDGSIELDEPFATQLGLHDAFNDPRLATVTVRQLLSHTSGLPVSRNIFFGHGVDTWQQAATAALGQTLQFDPGTAFQYSNANYCLLGLLIESVTGRPFETVIRDRVLTPIGANAHLAPTFDTAPGDALHASGPGRNYMETLGPAGGWVATPRDIAKLAAALRTESSGFHLLDRATVETMRAPVPVPVEVPAPASGWSYGLGLILFADGSWGHTGTIESTHAIVVNRPDGLTVAVLVSGVVPADTDDLLGVIDRAVVAGYSVVERTATFGPWSSPT